MFLKMYMDVKKHNIFFIKYMVNYLHVRSILLKKIILRSN
jgi:hypothetical protein